MGICFNTSSVLGCLNNGVDPARTVVLHYHHGVDAVDTAAPGTPLVSATNIDGSMVDAADLVFITPGACAVPTPDVEFEILCDVQTDGSVVQFVRRKTVSFLSDGSVNVAVLDTELDYSTAYTVTGTVGACPECPPLPATGWLNDTP